MWGTPFLDMSVANRCAAIHPKWWKMQNSPVGLCHKKRRGQVWPKSLTNKVIPYHGPAAYRCYRPFHSFEATYLWVGSTYQLGWEQELGKNSLGGFNQMPHTQFATHFIALDFRVCDVILRKTLGFDKLSKDSQVNIRWRIQRIGRITGSLWHGTWRRRPGSRPKCSDTSSLLSQPSASSNALEPWSQKFPTDCWTPQSGPSTPSQRRHYRQSAPRCKTAIWVKGWKLAFFRDPVLCCDCMCHQRMIDWSYALPVVFRTAITVHLRIRSSSCFLGPRSIQMHIPRTTGFISEWVEMGCYLEVSSLLYHTVYFTFHFNSKRCKTPNSANSSLVHSDHRHCIIPVEWLNSKDLWTSLKPPVGQSIA